MLNNLKTAAYLLVLGLLAVAGLIGITQAGPLDPPGPPGSTMKTLEEVEPRTPISSLPYTISAPGSYYLTGNLTGVAGQNGITITADNVTLDLNGFAVTGVPGSLNGINVSGSRRNVAVRNGTARDWGGAGVDATRAGNSHIEDLRLYSNDGDGLRVGSASIVENVVSLGNAGDGIEANSDENYIRGNVSVGNGAGAATAAGIHVTLDGQGNRIEANDLQFNDRGIDVDGAGNLIIKNSARSNTTEYDIVAGNQVGPIGSAATATSPWANIDY